MLFGDGKPQRAASWTPPKTWLSRARFDSLRREEAKRRRFDARGARIFRCDERLKELSAKGDDLERLNAIVDFEIFRADLEGAVPKSDRSRGGRPP
jgi:hypothetical protein